MALFEQNKIIGYRVLTTEEAMIIYTKLESGIHPSNLVNNHKAQHVKIVYKEAKRIETEIIQGVINNPNITAGELANDIISDILNKMTVGIDVVKWYNGDPATPLTFAEFKEAILLANEI